jgi:uncharacterized protein YkwD
MRVKNLFGRKTAAAIVVVGAVGLGLTGCLPAKPAPAPAAAASSASPAGGVVTDIYNAVNRDRASVGLPGFAYNGTLANNAANWARQMASANSLYHQNLSGLLGSGGYGGFFTLGENILVGPSSMSGATIESQWRGSAPHWANITNRSFNQIGIGTFVDGGGRVWAVQEFGGS